TITSGQLPPWAAFNIGQVVIRWVRTQQPESFDERVAAACQLAAGVAGTQALCDVFEDNDLPAWARNQIGRVILGLTGQGSIPNNIDKHKHEKNKGNNGNGNSQVSNNSSKPVQ